MPGKKTGTMLLSAGIVLPVILVTYLLWDSGPVQLTAPSLLPIVSLAIFCSLLLLACYRIELFFLLAPLVIVDVPNAVNDLLPSILLGPAGESEPTYFSFLTHIDIFFICGLSRYWETLTNRLQRWEAGIIYAVALCYVTYLVSYLVWHDSLAAAYFVMGGFHLRYALFAVLFCHLMAKNWRFTRYFLYGLFASACLLTVEALIFTQVYLGGVSEHRLTSGNLGHNVLGNFLAAMALSAYGCYQLARDEQRSTGLWFTLCLFFALGAFATETRASIGALYAGVVLIHWYRKSFRSLASPLVICLLAILVLHFWGNFSSVQNLDTSRTRLVLWQASLKMMVQNLLTGIGPGQWNLLKHDYGVPYDVLLDAHNDYLQFLACYGVPVGLSLILLSYGIVWIRVLRIGAAGMQVEKDAVLPILAVPLALSISSLSNSNLHEHQVFMIVIVLVMVVFNSGKNSAVRAVE